jgi:hypothetical protein
MAAVPGPILLQRADEIRLVLSAEARHAINLGKRGSPALDAVAAFAHPRHLATLRRITGGLVRPAGAGVWAVAVAHTARIDANKTDRIIGGLSLRSRKVGQLLAAQNQGF